MSGYTFQPYAAPIICGRYEYPSAGQHASVSHGVLLQMSHMFPATKGNCALLTPAELHFQTAEPCCLRSHSDSGASVADQSLMMISFGRRSTVSARLKGGPPLCS